MISQQTRMYELLDTLQERTRKLDCLYQVEELLKNYDRDIETVLKDVVEAIPNGLQYPDSCRARITVNGRDYQSPDFAETEWGLSADINVQDRTVGKLEFYYTREMPEEEKGSSVSRRISACAKLLYQKSSVRFKTRRIRKYLAAVDSR